MSMKYLVIQGRAPQDGSKARTALILCPTWMSSTLVCAGIVGRVTELTDGNITEERELPYTGGEDELLAEIRAEFDDRDNEEVSPTAVDPEAAQLPNTDPHAVDNAYREGVQSMRMAMQKTMIDLGMPEDAKPGQWMKEQLEELARYRAGGSLAFQAVPVSHEAHGVTTDLVTLPKAEHDALLHERDNLDAWRDASAAAGLCLEYDERGMVRKIYTAGEQGASLQARLDMMNQQWDEMGALLAKHGITEEDNRLEWLDAQLNGVAQGELMDEYQSLQEDYAGLNAGINQRDNRIEQLRSALKKARKVLKAAL